MKCYECGNYIAENNKFCPFCGAEVKVVANPEVVTNEAPKGKKVWDVFAKVSFGLGIAGLATCWIFGVGLEFSIPAIVFGALGKKSVNFSNKAKSGLTMGIIGTVLGFIFAIMMGVIIGIIEAIAFTNNL